MPSGGVEVRGAHMQVSRIERWSEYNIDSLPVKIIIFPDPGYYLVLNISLPLSLVTT